MSDALGITILPNGPIKLNGAHQVVFGDATLDVGDETYLCRCGRTGKAPFCDGTHRKVGFVGESEGTEPREIRVWEGETIRTFFNANICMHARACKPLKALREREKGGDESAAAEIAAVIGTCPSGALSFEMKNGTEAAPPVAASASVHIVEGGEVRVQRAFAINAELPERMTGDKATLCRCGLSKNKPWCDGRHATRTDFR